ncbi:MAG: hypothetical protein JW808_05110 [Victivallales bacterium]|nr:hypothetical protein [Victivallales bacterium]
MLKTNAKLKELFKEWQAEREYDGFFQDGVIGENHWEAHSPRIIFVLRENYSDDWGIDCPIDIRGGTNSKFFPNLARWKYLIDKVCLTSHIYDFPSEEELCAHQGGWCLSNVAYVNIKKEKGTSRSSKNDILNYAVKDKKYLKREIDAIDPQVVLCGGTFAPYHAIYDGNNTIREISRQVHMHGDRVVVNFYHPGWWQCPGGEKGLYGRLQDAIGDSSVIEAMKKACG